ncbi:conserved hypothetical protein [Magnetospirillum sp. LM-5]|uniref:DEAD/DEAH box helicase n=1 Tax=Magnetospirillum sp. LM-5 TaxID=2681466 RepID=UPI001383D53E|nr:type ISP restriction/modification enzyme [Magnetospirillum sp. LM-5]CAA7613313.1 conserved hypothetical protein [Magnetospirillum sp. LM-5]
MSALSAILETFRCTAATEREKGTYFERLVKVYLTQEPYYADLYAGKVWLWEEWRAEWVKRGNADPGADAGIDLVAETTEGDLHAIQAKFYADDAKLYLKSLGTFFTASGKKHFARRLIVHTTTDSTHQLQDAVADQFPPVNLLSLYDLENSKIDWAAYTPETGAAPLKEGKKLREYQETAIDNVMNGLRDADRGKLIMACGTGKTFTALRLAERMAGGGGTVLFLVPSLNLLSQTLTEWTQEAGIPLHSYAVCSDSEVGKKRRADSDDFEMLAHELQYPATTDPRSLARALLHRQDGEHMSVVFSTYHSIDVIAQAQHAHGLPEFDLILCDEAHRTTGATFEGVDESAFVKVHDQSVIRGNKRVYMTATPRVYGTAAKAKAQTDSIVLYSMDTEADFGKTLHTLSFSEAVNDLKILCDYKVIVLTISEAHVSKSLQRLLADAENSINVNDAAKIVGCWRALSKMDSQDDLAFDPAPMRRAVAFAQVIELQKGGKTHKISSKHIAASFAQVIDEYRAELLKENPENPEAISRLRCEADHVDGGMGAAEKNQKLEWLKSPAPEDTCRILSNVRCLSEGVDVPALDAVLFLTPRNSQVDVVQSVGRVMRKPHGGDKKLGYVILPVVIPADKSPDEALNDNQTYRVVWEVLQALRSHDDRFDAMINRMQFDGQDRARMEVIAVTDKIAVPRREESTGLKSQGQAAKKNHTIGKAVTTESTAKQGELEFEIGDIERAILAKVVQKCGNRLYWDEWAKNIADIASTHITRLTAILDNPENVEEMAAFDAFLADLHADLNASISRDEAIEMLAQHLITRPVFDALFQGYSFAEHNPVSKAMQGVLSVLERHHLEKESETLTRMYESVKRRAADTRTVAGKQKLIYELYDKFFHNAFPKMAERLGIVYTPVEVVDFIIHSINDVLQSEFGQTLGSRNVHILDPFTGTGTFVTRLLQSGLITQEELSHKYENEIHANEIVLLAYYIAAINIEQVYHSIAGGDYTPFNGICLTDTFNLPAGKESFFDRTTSRDNSTRLARQRNLDIRVIMGNPPYSAGQGSANDNNQNRNYPILDQRIRATYAAHSSATLQNSLYDSYIRAIRWASDRIGDSGIIGIVSNAGWIEGNAANGLRKCLAEEFSTLYVFHLRGNQRTSGELSRKEGGKIFASGSRAPIAISILVKNPNSCDHGKILFRNIGSYMSRDEKLKCIAEFGSIAAISDANGWEAIIPDEHGDWLNKRNECIADMIFLGDKKGNDALVLFDNYSSGIKTNRDAWCYNFSKMTLRGNIIRSIEFYNSEVDRFVKDCADPDRVDEFINRDGKKFSWDAQQKIDIASMKRYSFDENSIVECHFRPFSKAFLYFNRTMNNRVYQMPKIFPNIDTRNRVIWVVGMGATMDFACFISDLIPDLQGPAKIQCFPRYVYEPTKADPKRPTGAKKQRNLFAEDDDLFEAAERTEYTRRDAITDGGLEHFRQAYPGETITKDDLFYYVYGILHSEDYRTSYADNLKKELPRIPAVKTVEDFRAFVQAGRALAELHVGYESVTPYPVELVLSKPREGFTPADWRVVQMKFAKGTNGAKHDKTTVIYNHNVTMTGIPLEAYEYVVNGKPALEWVIERQAVTTHKESGIENDANDWANETMNNPAYPLELFQRVITVSLETMKIVNGLPPLDIL